MQVPSPTNQKQIGSAGQLAPVQANIPAGGLGANVAQSLSHLGANLQALDERTKARNDATEKFGALTQYSDFQQHMEQTLTEAKRAYPVDGKGFADHAAALYDQESRKFIAEKVPADLQDEFTYRVSTLKTGVVSDALSFQYKQGDAYFVQGINDQYQKSLSLVDANPKDADNQVKKLNEQIDATDLSVDDKQKIKHDSAIGIYGVLYKHTLKDSSTGAPGAIAGPITDGEGGAMSILKSYEGLRTNTYWDVNHHRVGYGSDTITNPDGSYRETRKGDTITPAQAEADLARRVKINAGQLADVAGGERWKSFAPNVQAGLISTVYNYGHVPDHIKAALRSGTPEQIAAAVATLPSGNPRRRKEAAIINGAPVPASVTSNAIALEKDPRFDNIPYQTKLQLQQDAEAEAHRDEAAQLAAQKKQHDLLINDLAVKLHDGVAGATDIQNMRDSGKLTDIDEIEKMETILHKKQEEGGDASMALMKLATGAPWDKNDKDSQKQLNAVVAQDKGLDKLAAGDTDYVGGQIIPMTSQSGMIPSSVAGVLATMLAGNNPKQGKFAFDTMDRLQQTSPEAFSVAFNDEQKSELMAYHALKDNVPDDQLMWQVRGGQTTEQRQLVQKFRADAAKVLAEKQDSVPTEDILFQKVIGSFDTSYLPGGPDAASNGLLKGSMMTDFHDTFVTEYGRYLGDTDKATEATIAMLKTRWGVTQIGEAGAVQKYPLEQMGYKAVNGDYEWVNNAIRADFKIPEGTAFSVLSDEQTKNEYDKYKADMMSSNAEVRAAARLPTFRVIIADQDGSYHFASGAGGERMWAKPSQADIDREIQTTNMQNQAKNSLPVINDFNRKYGHAGVLGLGGPIPTPTPEEQQKYDDAIKRRDDANEQLKILVPKPIAKAPSRMDAFRSQQQ